MTTRLSVNINDETEAALKELAAERGVTVTEIVRRSVGVYKYIEDEVLKANKVLQIADRNGTVERELAFL